MLWIDVRESQGGLVASRTRVCAYVTASFRVEITSYMPSADRQRKSSPPPCGRTAGGNTDVAMATSTFTLPQQTTPELTFGARKCRDAQ
ncbi:hypothetical protein Pcinc_020842 [Petrolisthes cinctipes]|uniref:Uncharacterized protein n=1 Tax=Petrolisthes cinctipes TaxID=88211 RepID=A0AAE1FLL0_PETCI|nr:hypothetical protein Pcinc_020842 [Petrolisthes cinctipes]